MAIESNELPEAATALTLDKSGPAASGSSTNVFEQGALLGELVAERYRVLELLGSGGMGCVYRAEHVHMRKSVAIKVLHRELTHLPDIVTRFEREAIAAARIAHPNVAAATDFGRLPDGACYLVLEYVQGRSLRHAILQSAPFDPQRALNIARQIALALGAAHDAGIVHRDLKPENVMLVDSQSDSDFIKVLDFGIAKIHMPEQESQTALTRMGTIFGTPEYMSPEQALGQTADSRTDLYSLGIILYEMLTGRTPFADKELVAVLTRQMTELPPPMPSDLDPSVVAIVMSLLAKRPSERPQTAAEIVTRIETVLSEARLVDGEYERASQVSVQTTNGVPLAQARSVASMPGLKVDALPLPKHSIPPWLRRSVRVGRRSFPVVLVLLFGLGAAFVILLFVTVIALVRPSSQTSLASASSSAVGARQTPAITRVSAPDPLVKQARLGDIAALKELEARPPTSLDAEHWAAIARGRARNRDWAGMLDAYEAVLDREPRLIADRELIGDIRSAAFEPTISAGALRFAAERLQDRGADLVFEAWSSAASGRGGQVDTKAAKKLLDSTLLRSHSSKALLAVLELSEARACGDFRRALPKVIADGDERCLRILRRLSHDRGCGLFGLGDCYGCLRGSNNISQAVEAAKARPAPEF